MSSRLPIALAAFSVAFFATDAIYTHAIVPRLPEIRKVPLLWWFGASLPMLIAPLVSGWRARSFVEVSLLGLCGAASYFIFLAATGQLMTGGGHDVEGSALVYLNALILAAAAFLLAAAGWIAKRMHKGAA